MKRIVALAMVLAGCAATHTEVRETSVEKAPTPYTADQIRAASATGRTYLFRMGAGDAPKVTLRMVFREVTDRNVTLDHLSFGSDGKPMGEVETTAPTWAELQSHASYPKSNTVIDRGKTTVPAGTFDCLVYTVTVNGSVTRAWFAAGQPGAPVRLEKKKGDEIETLMVLLEHRASFTDRVKFDHLWDYNNPAQTEAAFRMRLPEARSSGNPGYLAELLTQIARAQGLQQKFADAHATLDEVEKMLFRKLDVAAVRYRLERGRVFNSAKKTQEAVAEFELAWQQAQTAKLDGYAVDAAHMLGIAVPGEGGIAWNKKALALAKKSKDPSANRWLGSLYNNLGWTYAEKKDYKTALEYFMACRKWNEAQGRDEAERIARYSIGKMKRKSGHITAGLQMQRKIRKELAAKGQHDGYVSEEIGEGLTDLGNAELAVPHFAAAYKALHKDPWLIRDEPERLARLKKLGKVKDTMTETRTVIGIAQNAKAGAVVVTDDGPIYIEKLAEWPDEAIGKKVKATGAMVEREGGGTPTTAGIVGKYSVLTDAKWELN